MVLTRVDHTSSWCHESSAELGIWLYPLYKQVDIAATHFFGQDGGPISEFYVMSPSLHRLKTLKKARNVDTNTVKSTV